MAEDIAELERFLKTYLNRLGPAKRRRVSRKIGEALRRANTKRIAANVEPDGAAMTPRKPRKRLTDGKGRIKRERKMFPKIKLARSIKIKAGTDQVSVGFEGPVGHTATAHQLGLTDFVGRAPDGRVVRTKYPKRRLLGFGPDDVDALMDAALALLEE